MRTQIILSHINELRTFFLDNNYNCVIPLRRIEKKILDRNIEYYQELRATDGWTISIERRPWLKPFAVAEVRDELTTLDFLKKYSDWDVVYWCVEDVYKKMNIDISNHWDIIFENPPLYTKTNIDD
jgi:hypothetical protein